MLLEGCGRSCLFQPVDGLFGVRLADVLKHRLGGGVDQVLGLLEAELRQLSHRLDDVDLALADRGQRDRELGLLLFCGGAVSRPRGGCGGGGSHRSRGLDAELVLYRLDCFDHVEDAPFLERRHEVLGGDLGRHFYTASFYSGAPTKSPDFVGLIFVLYASSTPRSCWSGASMIPTSCATGDCSVPM